MESAFGFSFANVRIFDGYGAAEAARSLQANAFTAGEDIVFGRARYAPSSPSGMRLLAHELTHVVQQRRGLASPGLSRPHDASEQHADAIAERAIAGENVRDFFSGADRTPLANAVQRQYSAGTGRTDPNALIPLADFIRYIEAVERAYPADTPEQILTRIRTLYYSGRAFEHLIPTAPVIEAIVPMPARRVGPNAVTYATLPRTVGPRVGTDAYTHLTARADENRRGDNPSPYIVMPDNSQIDIGHLLLAMDALAHPSTMIPYTTYGVPNEDPAGWIADLGLASYWTDYHERTGRSPGDAAIHPPSASFDQYYAASAPEADLLADVDAYGAVQVRGGSATQPLSQTIRAYYSGTPAAAPALHRRWRTFCARNRLSYTIAPGGRITWAANLESIWVPRIDRMADLAEAGPGGAFWSVITPGTPARRQRRYSRMAFQRFLAWIQPRLEAEIAAHP